ncbi:MAG: ribokinase [Candidatus Cyclobacteriaceae bacterium M3_2C_046]
MPQITVIGSTNTDMLIKTSRLPKPGETVGGGIFSIANGGKGANQAVSASRAGGEVTFVTCVGDDDLGKAQLQNFREDHINTDFVFVQSENPTGVALITIDDQGENSIAVAPGANGALSKKVIEQSMAAIESADLILLQLEIPFKSVTYAIDQAYQRGKKILLNPAPAQKLDDALLKKLDTLVVNETEAELLSDLPVSDQSQIQKVADILRKKGPRNVIITLGAKGAYVLTDQDDRLIPGFKVKAAVDTTGAGDVFCGTLSVALAEGQSMVDAVKFAAAAAAISVTRLGAQPSAPQRKEIIDFLKK